LDDISLRRIPLTRVAGGFQNKYSKKLQVGTGLNSHETEAEVG